MPGAAHAWVMAEHIETPVLVVGGGPCGLLMALLLARAGVSCVVCEKHPGISTHPKAMGISRRTAEIYRQCGLLDAMMAEDHAGPDTQLMIWAKSLVGEEFGRAPLPPHDPAISPCHPFRAPQTLTEKVLLEALATEPLAQVLFGHRVTKITQCDELVEVEIESPEGKMIAKAEWLIAADGSESPVRNLLGIGVDGPGDLGHFLNVFFKADLKEATTGRESLLYNILRNDFVEFLVSVNGSDLWLMHHFLMPEETCPDEAAFIEKVRSAAGIPELEVQILGVAPWVMSPKVATQFRSNRIFLVGDAAARLSPAGGMGMNTGLQSVHNLAWKLASVWHGIAVETLLDSYEAERRALSLAVMAHTNENSSEVFAQVRFALSENWDGLRASIHGSHRQHEDTQFDVGVRYGESFRFPHVPLGEDDGSSLDWFGGRFVVVAGKASKVGASDLPEVFQIKTFPAECGCGEDGVVLVRPDGFIAWIGKQGATNEDLRVALAAALQ